jgi:hypothetical protein
MSRHLSAASFLCDKGKENPNWEHQAHCSISTYLSPPVLKWAIQCPNNIALELWGITDDNHQKPCHPFCHKLASLTSHQVCILRSLQKLLVQQIFLSKIATKDQGTLCLSMFPCLFLTLHPTDGDITSKKWTLINWKNDLSNKSCRLTTGHGKQL